MFQGSTEMLICGPCGYFEWVNFVIIVIMLLIILANLFDFSL